MMAPATNGAPAVPIRPAMPVPAPGPDSSAELAQVLSPSQATIFLGCPAKWYFKYLVGLPDPKTGALAVGIAMHQAIEFYMRGKLDGEMLDESVVAEACADAWDEQLDATEFREDEDPAALGAQAQDLVRVYIRAAAPKIEPAKVEFPVSGQIAGVNVQGFIDLLDAEGRIIDVKSRSKKPSAIPPEYRLQVATYDLLCTESRGQARCDFVTKTKVPKVHPFTIDVGPADVQYAETVYPMVQQSIRDGVFYPRRQDRFPCTRRYCPFWRACEKEFGGEVLP